MIGGWSLTGVWLCIQVVKSVHSSLFTVYIYSFYALLAQQAITVHTDQLHFKEPLVLHVTCYMRLCYKQRWPTDLVREGRAN